MRLLRALVGPAGRTGSCSFLFFIFIFFIKTCAGLRALVGQGPAGVCDVSSSSMCVFVVCVLETHNACLKLATQQHLLFLLFIYCGGRCVCVFVVFLLFMLSVPSSQHNSIYYSYYL
jgi:hypothetical protein